MSDLGRSDGNVVWMFEPLECECHQPMPNEIGECRLCRRVVLETEESMQMETGLGELDEHPKGGNHEEEADNRGAGDRAGRDRVAGRPSRRHGTTALHPVAPEIVDQLMCPRCQAERSFNGGMGLHCRATLRKVGRG